MKRFRTILFLLSLLCAFSTGAEETARPKSPPLNLAHRGLSGLAPENTLIAAKMALAFGCNAIECDVYRTSDGILILMHDRNMKRTAGVDIDVTKTTYEEIRRHEVGKWKGRFFEGEKVPTLEELLLLMKGTGCAPIIEIKQPGTEKDIAELLDKTGMLDDAFIVSFSSESLLAIKRHAPRIKVTQICSGLTKAEKNREEHARRYAELFMKAADRVGTKSISFNRVFLSRQLVDLLHENGYDVWTGPINDETGMNKVLNWGVDVITTDRSDILSGVLKQRAAANKKEKQP